MPIDYKTSRCLLIKRKKRLVNSYIFPEMNYFKIRKKENHLHCSCQIVSMYLN